MSKRAIWKATVKGWNPDGSDFVLMVNALATDPEDWVREIAVNMVGAIWGDNPIAIDEALELTRED